MIIAPISLMSCSEESNPYKDRYENRSSPSGDAVGERSSTGVPAVGSNTGAAGETGVKADEVNASDTKVVAEPNSIAKEVASATQVVCQSPTIFTDFKAEFEILCLNGQPTAAFAALLSSPYKGVAPATVSKIKSANVNNVSEFIFATSSEISSPIATVVGKRGGLGVWTFTEGSATFTGTRVAELAAMGPNSLGGYETKDVLVVKVGPITINDERLMKSNWIVVKEGQVVTSLINLKPGASENTDNTVANILTLLLAEGQITKFVAVTRQEVANSGQPAKAETTALAVARRIAEEGYLKLSN